MVHVDGTLTVTPAPLTITAVDQARIYGDENPDAPVISGLRVREYHGIGGGKVSDLTGNESILVVLTFRPSQTTLNGRSRVT